MSGLRTPAVERARYNDLTPAEFGAHFGRSADWARGLVKRKQVVAVDTNRGGKQRRLMIPPTEVERFRKASMVNPELLGEG